MTTKQALRFIERHGIVLEAGQGAARSLLTETLGATVTGSWWGHPEARQFFSLTRALRESPQLLVCRLIDGKITYVHRRLWPALVQLADQLGRDRLTKIHEVHTASGRHVMEETPFPKWVPADVRAAARQVIPIEATQQLDRFTHPTGRRRARLRR